MKFRQNYVKRRRIRRRGYQLTDPACVWKTSASRLSFGSIRHSGAECAGAGGRGIGIAIQSLGIGPAPCTRATADRNRDERHPDFRERNDAPGGRNPSVEARGRTARARNTSAPSAWRASGCSPPGSPTTSTTSSPPSSWRAGPSRACDQSRRPEHHHLAREERRARASTWCARSSRLPTARASVPQLVDQAPPQGDPDRRQGDVPEEHQRRVQFPGQSSGRSWPTRRRSTRCS
jgi:hypothetical protein